MDLYKEMASVENDIINWRRELHKRAEVGLDLPKTKAYLTQELEKMGIEYKEYQNCSGLSAVIGKKEDGKVVALRADFDALPIQEEVESDYMCTTGTMHACGHDAHSAMLLGVAKVLKNNEDKLNGRVKLIFQPGEEYDGGAKVLIDEGVLQNPKVDAFFGQHVFIAAGLPTGTIACRDGVVQASSDSFYMKINGKGGHAASPEECIDPIVMATQVVNNLYSMVSREVSALNSVCLSIVNVKSEQPSGGTMVYNIIPNYVEIVASVRCIEKNLREFMEKRIGEVAKATVEGLNGTLEYKYNHGYPALSNDTQMVNLVERTAKSISGEHGAIRMPKPVMGSEDASYYLEQVPGAYYAFVVGDLNKEGYYPLHNPKMKLDEDGLYKGASILLQTAINYLEEN